jgi:hypothetical protein
MPCGAYCGGIILAFESKLKGQQIEQEDQKAENWQRHTSFAGAY